MEQNDFSLHGQDDIFDLENTEKGLKKKGGLSALGDEDDMDTSDEGSGDEEDDDEVLGLEEERERKANELEAELDGLYDAYQERMNEKDAKYKVKEARKNSKGREEWAGFRKDDSDEDSDDSEGGYDVMARAKEKAGDGSDSESDSEDDSDTKAVPRTTKRPRTDDAGESSKLQKKARTDIAKIPQPKGKEPLSRHAEVWFSQGLFKQVDLSDIEDDEDMEDEQSEEEMDVDSEVDVEEGPSRQIVRSSLIHHAHFYSSYYRLLRTTRTISRLSRRMKSTKLTCGMSRMKMRTRSSRRRSGVSFPIELSRPLSDVHYRSWSYHC